MSLWKLGVLALAWLVAYALMERWSDFEKFVTGAIVWLGYYLYTTAKEVDDLRRRLDSLIYKIEGGSD